ncbi:MAG: apolipoprotein N-acyltransferase [Alkalispirochaeta sp.]
MLPKTEYPPRLVTAVALSGVSLATILFAFAPEISIAPIDMGSVFYLVFVMLHPAWALSLLVGGPYRPVDSDQQRRAAEILFFLGLFLFLFAYIFAGNANMDYVQRFITASGNLQLAPDTGTERRIVTGRYVPLLLVDLLLWGMAVVQNRRGGVQPAAWRAPVLTLLSVALSVFSNPSFADVQGISWLGWIALVPLFVMLRRETAQGRPGHAVGYGVLFGVLFTLVGNYWLGTFNLISLQAVGVIFLGFYVIYTPVTVFLLRIVPPGPVRAAVLPLSWTVFEAGRSAGFLGYPWLLTAHSQYRNLPVIQWAEFGGVWLVSLIVLVVNAALAEAILARRGGESVPRGHGAVRGDSGLSASRGWILVAVSALAVSHGVGALLLARDLPSGETVRMALVQQNSDPRKHDYGDTLDALKRITDETLQYDPDLIVWSETAFVPNIRRWSQEDPERYRLARLVREFSAYQESLGRWLVTGNDDYRRVLDDDGNEVERNSYNAAVLFSASGERQETYHKIRLVPFTEHFPYQRQFPWVYSMLQEFDVTFWTPGAERTIFHHPQVRFATPICFEDAFPQEVRRFALNGMEVIVNLTNDYWSLQETAARQHFAAALFRTVELRRPMVRATASGVTSHIDARGSIVATTPQYSEQYLIADVAVPAEGTTGSGPSTLYMRWGDWVPYGSALVLVVFALGGAFRRKERSDHE